MKVNRIQAERELDWFFNVFPSCVGLAALNPAAINASVRRDGYTDHQLDAINHSLSIRKALRQCTRKTCTVLELGFTVRAYRGSEHHDLEVHFGKLTGIVKRYKLDGDNEVRKRKAETMLRDAIQEFMLYFETDTDA